MNALPATGQLDRNRSRCNFERSDLPLSFKLSAPSASNVSPAYNLTLTIHIIRPSSLVLARLLSFAFVAAVLVFFLQREATRGGLDTVDRVFLDWLVANSSKRVKDPELTFLRLTDVEGSVFEAWPPSPLDYAVILKNLQAYEPRMVLIAPTLAWRIDDEITTGALRTQLLRTPRVLFGCVLQDNPVSGSIPPENDPVGHLETVSAIIGEIEAIPSFTGLLTLPEEEFLTAGELGFTEIDLGPDEPAGSFAVPLLARRGDSVYPSFILKAILLQSAREASDLLVRLGDSIEIRDTGIRIPIDSAGYFTVFPGVREHIPQVDAEALFASGAPGATAAPAAVSSAPPPSSLDSLRKSIILIGVDHPGARQIPFGNDLLISRAERIAAALATIQSGRYIARLLPIQVYAVWGGAILVGVLLLLLRVSRAQLLGMSLLAAFFYCAASLILFQAKLFWMSPVIPVSLLLAAGLFGAATAASRREAES